MRVNMFKDLPFITWTWVTLFQQIKIIEKKNLLNCSFFLKVKEMQEFFEDLLDAILSFAIIFCGGLSFWDISLFSFGVKIITCESLRAYVPMLLVLGLVALDAGTSTLRLPNHPDYSAQTNSFAYLIVIWPGQSVTPLIVLQKSPVMWYIL